MDPQQPTILQKHGQFEKNEHPLVSIIVCSKNLKRYLRETLNSISNQSFKNFEVVVVDGNSTDGSLEIFKEYENIRLIVEKDTGYPDAFWKGLRVARGKYIMNCCVSDAYANERWVEECVEYLEKNPDVSLVWGLPQRLSEKSVPGPLLFSRFQKTGAPEKSGFFGYWLTTRFNYTEGNLCCRKNVLEECYPKVEEFTPDLNDWLEFSYRFNERGFWSHCLPVLANFGRTHEGQLGERNDKADLLRRQYKNYYGKIFRLRLKIILGLRQMTFRRADDTAVENFDQKKFLREYARFVSVPKNCKQIIKDYMRTNWPLAKKIQKYLLGKVQHR